MMAGRACGEGVGEKHLILFYLFIIFRENIYSTGDKAKNSDVGKSL